MVVLNQKGLEVVKVRAEDQDAEKNPVSYEIYPGMGAQLYHFQHLSHLAYNCKFLTSGNCQGSALL